MLCKQCGFDLSNQANFCSSCGKKIDVAMVQDTFPQKQLVKWLKIFLFLILASAAFMILFILFSKDMTDTVKDQLKAIKQGKIEDAYYDFTSKSFQNATSLERFYHFMADHSDFSQSRSIRFINRSRDNDQGFLHALILKESGEETPVLYRFFKERDKWLIESISLDNPEEPSSKTHKNKNQEEVFDSSPLKTVIKDQLHQIQEHNLIKAYNDYTSADFKNTTPFKEFETFVNQAPAFNANNGIELGNLSFDNNIATITGLTTTVDSKEYAVEYDLVQEEGNWKIVHVEILNSAENGKEKTSRLEFSKFILGSEVGENNKVTLPKTVFNLNSGDIYLNLYLNHVSQNTSIQVVFKHENSQSSIPPVSKLVSEKGDVILTFIFSPPSNGWPKGDYRLYATASTGEKSTYDFQVEE